MDLTKFESTNDVTAVHNDDGSVTHTWKENFPAWCGIGLSFDEAKDLSEQSITITSIKFTK